MKGRGTEPMKRKSSLAMVVALAAGAGAVVFLVLNLMGDDGPGHRGRGTPFAGTSGGANGGRGGAETGTVATVVTNRGNRSGRGILGRNATPKREGWDDATTIAERARMSSRVLALLDQMMALDRTKIKLRQDTYRELLDLVRKLGHRVALPVKQKLLEMLTTVEPGQRWMIGEILGQMQGDKAVAIALLDKVRDGSTRDTWTLRAIYNALGKIHAPGVNEALLDMLGKNLPLEHQIVRAIGQSAGPAETRKLLDMLGKPLKSQTESAIFQVLRLKRGLPGLLDEVATRFDETTEPGLQQKFLSVLGLSNDQKHVQKIQSIFYNTPHPTVRHAAIRVLGKLGDKKSGQILLELVEKGTPDDRRRAASAMSSIRDRDTIDALAGHWRTLGASGRRAVMAASAQLPRPTERVYELARTEGLRDSDMLTRMRAARVLGRTGVDKNVEPLVRFVLESKHAGSRTAAFHALKKIRSKKAAEAALSALHVVPHKVRRDQLVREFEKILAQFAKRGR